MSDKESTKGMSASSKPKKPPEGPPATDATKLPSGPGNMAARHEMASKLRGAAMLKGLNEAAENASPALKALSREIRKGTT